jgi:tRNA threonylcarbamoyl adenosine modification protein (Sua5/YciO/YrdC/YwlC family)
MITYATRDGEPGDEIIEPVVRFIREGEVVILPTDTIYGLHCDALSETAVERIFAVKERERGKPLVVLGASLRQLEDLGAVWSDEVRELLQRLWPAPFTAVIALSAPIAASAGTKSLAVRIPALHWLRALIDRAGPIASTSLNVSGENPIASLQALPEAIISACAAGVDAGPLEGLASTVVDLTGDAPEVVREGAVPAEATLARVHDVLGQ